MSVVRDQRSEHDPRFSKRTLDSYRETGAASIFETLDRVYGLDPDWAELFTQYVRGDLYSRQVLSQATRETCACSALASIDKQEQLGGHLRTGHKRGASKEELLEAILQSVVYGGFPAALNSLKTYAAVFPDMVKPDRPAPPATAERLPEGPLYQPAVDTATAMYGEQYARGIFERFNRWDGDFSMAVQRFVFGGLYARTVVEPKIRQLMAVACLTVRNALPQLETHTRVGLRLGLSRAEVQEIILQMTTYCGFPYVVQAMAVFDRVAEAWEKGEGRG